MRNLLNKKIFLIPFLTIIIILLLFSGTYLFLYFNFDIKGSKTINLNYKEKYIDKGYQIKLFKDKLNNIEIINNVDTNKLGTYKVIYSFKYLFLNIKKERIVNVLDLVEPKIKLNGSKELYICPSGTYKEEGFTAIDNVDGDLTDKVKATIKDNKIIYEVNDLMGNKTSIERIIYKVDKESPILTLNGSDTIYIRKGIVYSDMGYNVIDNCDNNVKVTTESNINTSKTGKYKIKYTAVDQSNNKTSIERNVIVYEEGGEGVIYLTFDDGPSDTGTTSQILDILKEEGVKATFFVTGKGPDSLIQREYNEGHTIGLHTNTHDYSYIYSSPDNFFNDLNSIKNRVYNLTGLTPTITRFPGGSNNTVSNRYSYGIMDTLTRMVLDKGYTYFDWNVSSEDAGSCATTGSTTCVYNNTINGLRKGRNNIVLMHDIKWYTVNALRDVIRYGKQNGYSFATLNPYTTPVRFK